MTSSFTVAAPPLPYQVPWRTFGIFRCGLRIWFSWRSVAGAIVNLYAFESNIVPKYENQLVRSVESGFARDASSSAIAYHAQQSAAAEDIAQVSTSTVSRVGVSSVVSDDGRCGRFSKTFNSAGVCNATDNGSCSTCTCCSTPGHEGRAHHSCI